MSNEGLIDFNLSEQDISLGVGNRGTSALFEGDNRDYQYEDWRGETVPRRIFIPGPAGARFHRALSSNACDRRERSRLLGRDGSFLSSLRRLVCYILQPSGQIVNPLRREYGDLCARCVLACFLRPSAGLC